MLAGCAARASDLTIASLHLSFGLGANELDEKVIESGVRSNPGLELGGSANRCDPTVINEGDAVAELLNLIHVMRGDYHGRMEGRLQVENMIPDCLPRPWVETNSWLIQKEDFGAMEQALGYLEAPDHAAGIVPDQMIGDF